MEAPITVTNTVGTFLIGSPTFVWAEPTAFVNEHSTRDVGAVGVKLLNDSTAIPLPPLPTAKRPYMPIAVARGAKLLAVWGTSSDTTGSGVWHQDTLWQATLEAGRWSPARPIWTAGEFVWHPGAASFADDDTRLFLAFPSSDTTRNRRHGLTIMMHSRGRWSVRLVDAGGYGPQGVAVLSATPTELLIAAVGSLERDGIQVPNGVYTIRVAAHDWGSAPRFTVIRDMKKAHAEDPSVFRTPQGVHIVWRQPGGDVSADDSLVEATTRDHGESWAVTSAVSLEGDTRGMIALPLVDDDAVAMALDIRRQKILTLHRSMDHWALRPEAFPEAKTIPMISAPRNRTSVSFGQTRSSTAPEGLYDAPVLVTTSRAHRCEPTSAMSSQKRLRAPPRGKSTLR
ncbi:MAG: hypothetical protein ACJ79A_20265 [Gemmatimonadaceae bacterium]